jgi:hypothetical protein
MENTIDVNRKVNFRDGGVAKVVVISLRNLDDKFGCSS